MPNWCATNWTVRGKAGDIQKLADIFNSLKEREDVRPNGFGKQWLGNLAAALGYDFDKLDEAGANMRGTIDSNGSACACLILGQPDSKPFRTETDASGELSTLRFTTQSAWGMPDWFTDHLDALGVEYGYKATDEFGNFHVCHNPDLIGAIYELEDIGRDIWEEYRRGEEDRVLARIQSSTGIEYPRERLDKEGWEPLLEMLAEYNEDHEDEEVYLHPYIEE